VTSASAERLGLERGQVVVASFKATGARLVPLRDEPAGPRAFVTFDR
jgi:hypothetical protein